jgi:hypothetical protein
MSVQHLPEFTKISTWTERLGQSRLRSFTDAQKHFWLEQNPDKASKWAKLARQGEYRRARRSGFFHALATLNPTWTRSDITTGTDVTGGQVHLGDIVAVRCSRRHDPRSRTKDAASTGSAVVPARASGRR